MNNPEANVMQSVVTRGNGKENKSQKPYMNKMSTCTTLAVESEIAEAEERAEKLKQGYLRAYKKYTESDSCWQSFYKEAVRIKTRCHRVGYCVDDCNKLVEQLQKALDNLSSTEATSRKTEPSYHSLQFLMLHGTKSLAQEKVLLRQKTESQQQDENEMSQEKINFKWINMQFDYMQRMINRHRSQRPIHDLLRQVKEAKKLREKAIVNGALDNNPTSYDSLTKSMKNQIKLLKKVVRELEKDRRETENMLQDARTNKDFAKKTRHLEKESEDLHRKWDEEKKHVLGLKKKHDRINV